MNHSQPFSQQLTDELVAGRVEASLFQEWIEGRKSSSRVRGYDVFVSWKDLSRLIRIHLLNSLSSLGRDRRSESYDSDSTGGGGELTDIKRADRPAPDRRASSSNSREKMSVFTLRSGLSSAIIVMLGVFTWTLSWTEIVHMSRMIHVLARAHNPLLLRWIIYTTLPCTPSSRRGLTIFAPIFSFSFTCQMWCGTDAQGYRSRALASSLLNL